jgi:hypothetical protein
MNDESTLPPDLPLEKCVLVGPPESRSRQRRLGIVKYTPLPGSEKRLCTQCGNKLWLGPKQLTFLANHSEVKLICWSCLPGDELRKNAAVLPLGEQGGDYWLEGGGHIGAEPKS